MTLRLVFAVLVLAPGCNPWRTGDSAMSVDHIRVPHNVHKAKDVDCIACHDGIWDETTLGEAPLPGEDKCLECHGEQKEKGNCAFCHTDVKKARPWPKRETELVMNHKNHVERAKEDCSKCHKELPTPFNDPARKPPMSACFGCHNHQEGFEAGKCTDCHTDLSHYPLKPITAYSHGGNYVQRHSRDARSGRDQCQICHEQTFCSDCHSRTVGIKIELKNMEKVTSDFIHRNDWISRHAIEAKWQPATCMRCHGSTFCTGCHTMQNLTSDGNNPRSPHPAGYAQPTSTVFHGTDARRDITRCAACHEQGQRSNCVDCHKVGGIGGNPHPLGWTDRHPQSSISKNGMCLYCHQ